ncbi:MAG: alpha/beta hydrolase [Senegalia sp. (in: firmicutes)]|uniref:alpha/beta hydrolase n=1 Tax=Senegalia sp. (in: firmicutes) TaxID=1924098 RepID=UPI003F95E132
MNQFFINQENVCARVCEWGSKDNPTIICIHGLGSTNLSFLEVGELLSDKYHIFSIELPGHGKTPAFKNDEDYGIPNLLEWLAKVINTVEKESFYLMAHSWGGCVALHYASENSERVKKMMLLDGGYHLKQFSYEYFSNLDRTKLSIKPDCSLEEEIQSYEEDFEGYVFSNWEDFLEVEKNSYLRWSELLEQAAKDLMKVEQDGKIKFCASGDTARGAIKSMYNFPTDVLYNRLDIPILLLQATLPEGWDKIRTLQVKELQKGTNAVVKRVEATHLLHWDNPNLVAEEVISWMK